MKEVNYRVSAFKYIKKLKLNKICILLFQLFINNEWRNSLSGKTFKTFSPSTGQKICDVQEGDKEDVDLAVKVSMFKYFFN